MAAKIQKVTIKAQAQGFKKAAGQVKTLGDAQSKTIRAQQNLGKASASSGRQFAAQSQGLGGLVSAYAGAAATVFALQQAFSALSAAAQFDQIIQGTNTLAAAVGANGTEILNSVREITKGQLTLIEASRSVNIALSAGFNQTQIEGLTQVSLKASRALGRNLTDALTRLTRGTAKLEPELLDELGIFTRIEPAVEAYAVSLGKSAASLTSFERRQAFVNAAIEEGQRKFGAINTVTPTTAESFEAFSASFIDLGYNIGSVLTKYLAPLAEFFTDNLLAKVTLFAVVGVKVFGVALRELGSFGTKTFAGMSAYIDTGINKINAWTTSTKKATASLKNLQKGLDPKSFELSRLTKDGKADISGLVQKGREGNLDIAGVNRLEKALLREQAAVKKTIKDLEKRIATAKAAGRSTKTLEGQLKSRTASEIQLAAAIQRTNVVLKRQGIIARTTAKSLLFVEKSIKGIGKALGVIGKIVNFVVLFGTAIAAVVSVLSDWLGITEKLNRIFTTFGRYLKVVNGGSKEAAEGITAITNSAIQAQKELKNFPGLEIEVDIGFGPFEKTIKEQIKAEDIQKTIQSSVSTAIESGANNTETAKIAKDAIESLLGKSADDFSEAERKLGSAIQRAVINAVKSAEGAGVEQIGALANSLGIAGQEITNKFQTELIKGISGGSDKFKLAIKNELAPAFTDEIAETLQKGFKFETDASGSKQLQETLVSVTKLAGDFQKGLTNAEDSARQLSGILTRIKDLESLGNLNKENQEALKILKQAAEILKIQTEQTSVLVTERKKIVQIFGAEIKAYESLLGYANKEGKFAATAEERRLNQVRYLKETVANAQLELDIAKEYGDESQRTKDLEVLLLTTRKALVGAAEKNFQAQKKITDELKKQTNQLTKQARELNDKTFITLNKQAQELLKSNYDLRNQSLTVQIKQVQQSRQLASALNEVNRTARDFELTLQEALSGTPLVALLSSSQKRELKIELETRAFEDSLADLIAEFNSFAKSTALQAKILDNKIKVEIQTQRLQKVAFEKQADVAQKTAEAQIASSRLQRESFERRANFIIQEGELYKGHVKGIAEALAQSRFQEAFAKVDPKTSPTQLGKTLGLQDFKADSLEEVRKEFVRIQTGGIAALNDLSGAQRISNDLQKDYQVAITKYEKAVRASANATNNAAQAQINANKGQARTNALEEERAALLKSVEIKYKETEAAIQNLTVGFSVFLAQIEASNSMLAAVVSTFVQSFETNLQGSLESLFESIAKGTLTLKGFRDGFNQFLYNILADIQKSIIQEGLVTPITDYLKESITKLPGLSGFADKAKDQLEAQQRKVLEDLNMTLKQLNQTLSGGISAASGTNTGRSADASARLTGGASSAVTDPIALRHGGTIVGSDRGLDVNAEKKKTADLLQGTQEQTTGFLDNISGATIATFATVAAATGDFKTAMIATFAQMFLEIAIQKAVASFGAGAAHGGSVPFGNKVQSFAGGGSVVARRDRVPALLEPGEFVIRKPAAKAIGGSALNQLNATGKMNSGNNVVVNVQNNGTPQQVETTQVRTDTGQMIIDLVVKDIQNNGRVRKAMRG